MYFCICKGVYGLPQDGEVTNNLLCKRLATKGYYEAATTPVLRLHKLRLVMFCLTVDYFGFKYVGKQHHNISSPPFRNITQSLITEKGRNKQALISSGTKNPVPDNSPWKTTSGNSFSDMAIQRHKNHIVHPTSIAKLYTAQASISH